MTGVSILISGATGIMGSWALGESLRRGYRPYVLMRDATEEEAQRRLRAVLRHVDQDGAQNRVTIVRGDASQPNLGLSDEEGARLRERIDGFLHCAACTKFDDQHDEEVWAVNVGGVENILRYLDGTGVPLYHVSTAYVSGDRKGRVYETELDERQGFRNTYERSKCAAEKLVRRAMEEGSIAGSIFRPSIIVGAEEDGRISSFLNFYAFFRFVDLALGRKRRTECQEPQVLRLVAGHGATKNFITVDWTTRLLWDIVEAEGPSGHTYHLTHPEPTQLHSLLDWANAMFCDRNLRVAFTPQLPADASPLEVMAKAAFQEYEAYITDSEPLFDLTNTNRALGGRLQAPRIDAELYTKLLGYARERRWRSIFHQVHAASGAESAAAMLG